MDEDPRLSEARAISIQKVVDALEINGLTRVSHELVGPCPSPSCGGTDRFAVSLHKGVFNCRKCLAKGDGIALVQLARGLDFMGALEWLCGERKAIDPEELARREKLAAENKAKNEAEAEKRRAAAIRDARRIWQEGRPPEGTPVRDYLTRRGLTPDLLPVLPVCLRYHADLAFTVQVDRQYHTIHRGPAMLAAVQGPDGRFSAVHRTWIDLTQAKGKPKLQHPVTGAAQPAKKVLGSKKGGAIRLSGPAHAAPVMVMGEGIETTLTAMVAGVYPGAAIWAGVDLGNMGGVAARGKGLRYAGRPDLSDDRAFVPPEWVRTLIYLMDGDSDPVPTRAILECGLRRAMALRPGLAGKIAACPAGFDLNDVLVGGTA